MSTHLDGWFLTNEKDLALCFLQQLLTGNKQVIYIKDLSGLTFLDYKEFTVKELFANLSGDDFVRKYLPDPLSQARPIPREYAYKVLAAIKP